MPGRPLLDEATLIALGLDHPELVWRRHVLRETLAALRHSAGHYHARAAENLARWAGAAPAPPTGRVEVHAGDWGVVAAALTREHGTRFAVLNMANAFVPGGAYIEGTAAQEENLFRRTDAHFAVDDAMLGPDPDRYRPEMTALLSASQGRVYLDLDRPRVCIRGPEQRDREDLGYRWLEDDEVFPFYELRAAAVDLRSGDAFDPDEMRRRVRAQLDTLRDADVRHAVLSAFGCGAFGNPAAEVARLYREELDGRRDDFAVIAFAIFHPGYGPDNHAPFAEALSGG